MEIISVRAPCPWCETPLSGEIKHVKNIYKLDNGDPDFVEKTQCPNCDKWVFTRDDGMHLMRGYENVRKTKK